MKVLGIETSCDETSVSIVEDGKKVLSLVISSQIDVHKIFGGVVPEIASRKHVEIINYVYKKALKDALLTINDIDLIAVTKGPGLVGALLVGLSFAKALSLSTGIPYICVNHIEGHICANYITNKELAPPFVGLVVSGGHTYLLEVKDYLRYKIFGKTIDDACGECFDKVARVMNLPYPGGPKIEEKAKYGRENIYPMPYGEVEDRRYDFTYSGLKSHTINIVRDIERNGGLNDQNICDISRSFQDAIIKSLLFRTVSLSNALNIKKVAICGGVSANDTIIETFRDKLYDENIEFYNPDKIYCTDNAAMIASAGYYRYINAGGSDLSENAEPNMHLGGEL